MKKPLLFISHKHKDDIIANTVAGFVRNITGGQVDVFLSSNPDFEGPRVGKELNKELKNALWHAGVVILIYTSDDKDWAWCMWECGLADVPESPDTKVIVIQCLEDKPKVFQSGLNVLAGNEDSITQFAFRFRDTDLFPGRDEPVTGLKDEELKQQAKQLFHKLQDVIPNSPEEKWSAWPFLRLKLSLKQLDQLKQAYDQSPEGEVPSSVLGKAVVYDYGSGLKDLFGKTEVGVNSLFDGLIQRWVQKYPERSLDWLDIIIQQILASAGQDMPIISNWTRVREVKGNTEFIPVVSRVKSGQSDLYFDCYFLAMADFPLVSTRMVRVEHMYYIDLTKKKAAEIVLREQLDKLEMKGWKHIPILEKKKAKYILHVSMINLFIRKHAYFGNPVEDLTLKDLLNDEEMKEMFMKTFVVVNERATLDDAQKKMNNKENCLDIFVTKQGGLEEEVVGWLTDRDLT